MGGILGPLRKKENASHSRLFMTDVFIFKILNDNVLFHIVLKWAQLITNTTISLVLVLVLVFILT